MKIILDTNALMVPAEFGVDIFSELAALGFDEWLVPPGVARELEGIASRGRGKGRGAGLSETWTIRSWNLRSR